MRKTPFPMLWRAVGTFLVLGLTAAFAAESAAQNLDPPQRVSFQISSGSTTGTYFPIGELLAQLLSHPPGVGRCVAEAPAARPARAVASASSSARLRSGIANGFGSTPSKP